MKPTAFIASSAEGLNVAKALQAALNDRVDCLIWTQDVFELSHYPVPDLEKVFCERDFALFVFSDDDIVTMRGEQKRTVRDNVILEFGLSVGLSGLDRSLVIQPAHAKGEHLPTDIQGITVAYYELCQGLTINVEGAVRTIVATMDKRGPKNVLFTDAFAGDLNARWQFRGGCWVTASEGTLVVKGTPEKTEIIGITKVGDQWTNYVAEFRARIVQGCLGVVMRARDLSSCYMVQIWKDKIRPHRLDAAYQVTLIASSKKPLADSITQQGGRWDDSYPPAPLTAPLADWFNVRLAVHNADVSLCINDQEVLSRPGFLGLMAGGFGFRNSDSEEAQVRDLVIREIR